MNYNYDIMFSNRRSISITVTVDNKIILRCPLGMSRQRAESFLTEKSDWIERAVKRNETKNAAHSDVVSYEKVFVNGQKLPLFTCCSKRKITEDGVFVKDIKDIKKLYCSTFLQEFLSLLNEIAKVCGLNYNSVTVKNYKSRWGCCDGKNNISFNYKVFMLPIHIRKYVIIHELCHTVHHDHSKTFWKLVEKFLPDYKSTKKQLRGYDFLTTLY